MRPDEEPDGRDPPQGDAAGQTPPRVARKPHLTTALTAVEEAITEVQTAQITDEGNPVRLESLVLALRNERAILLDLLRSDR